MPVVVGIGAIGVALLMLLVAYALTVLFTPLLEGLAREVPVVGGYIAKGIKAAMDYARHKIVSYVNTGVDLLRKWFVALTDAATDFVEAVNRAFVDLPGQLQHLKSVTVPRLIENAIGDVRADARAAATTADRLRADLSDVWTKPLSDFKGIEHGVTTRIDHALDTVRTIDLPNVLGDAELQAQRGIDRVHGEVGRLADRVDHDFNYLVDQIGKLPLTTILAQLASLAGAAALVDVIAREGGLDKAECRAKVKGICSTDPAAWQALLDVAGFALVWMGMREFVALAQDFARETLPTILEQMHGG